MGLPMVTTSILIQLAQSLTCTAQHSDSLQVSNLLKAGFDVTVWNRTPDRCQALREAGAKVCALHLMLPMHDSSGALSAQSLPR